MTVNALNRFEWYKAVLQAEGLSATTKNVAGALAIQFANNDSGQINPSQDTLADYLKVHKDTIKRALRELRNAGWLYALGDGGREADWDANAGAVDYGALSGRECWAGLDLSQSRDLTAFVLVFPDEKGGFDVLPRFFLPEQGIREKAELDRVPYDLWAKQGFLTLIPGAVVDPTYVAEAIAEASHDYQIQMIAYDRWRMEYLRREFDRLGVDLPIESFGQGHKEMAPAVDKLERLVAENKLRHAGNPILTFCAANAVVELDAAGNRKLAKNKSSGRIDGLVVLTMALAAVDRECEDEVPACIAALME